MNPITNLAFHLVIADDMVKSALSPDLLRRAAAKAYALRMSGMKAAPGLRGNAESAAILAAQKLPGGEGLGAAAKAFGDNEAQIAKRFAQSTKFQQGARKAEMKADPTAYEARMHPPEVKLFGDRVQTPGTGAAAKPGFFDEWMKKLRGGWSATKDFAGERTLTDLLMGVGGGSILTGLGMSGKQLYDQHTAQPSQPPKS